MQDLITVCLPTYRRPTLLLQTLLSCIAQDYRPLEIDVGDDSPGNESEIIVHSLLLPDGVTLRYWRNHPSLGQAGNVNRLFAKARGKRLVLMHDDDLLLPGAIKAMADAWTLAPDIVAVYGMQQILTDSGELDQEETDYKAVYYRRNRQYVGEQKNLLVSALWRQFPNNGYLIETAAAREAGYRSFEEVGHACDTDFSVRLAMYARGRSFYMIDRLTSQYRYNVNSLSRSVDVTWKFFEYLLALDGLDADESKARDSLLREIAAQATKENALRGRRFAALKIFFSRFYPRNQALVKSLYHLGLTITPRTRKLRQLSRIIRRSAVSTGKGAIDALRSVATDDPNLSLSALPSVGDPHRPRDEGAPTVTIVSQLVRLGHGQGRANLELAREALRRGFNVNIVACDIDDTICRHPNVTIYRLDVRRFRTQLVRDALFDLRAQSIVRRLRRTSDIIHVNGAVVTTRSDVNTAHFIHNSHVKFHSNWKALLKSPYSLYQYAYTVLNTVMERHCFRQAKSVVAVSHNVADDLVSLGIDRSKISVIYNGTDLDEFSPGQENRATLGLPPDVTLGIFVGDIRGNRKNLDTVLRALVLNEKLHLAVLANFDRSHGPNLAAHLGVADRVYFLGERSDVAAVMRTADMLIFPSRYEPFGMVVLEALASGLPVITSRAAGASEIIEPGCGILIDDPNDTNELSSAMMLLTDDPALRKRMGALGRVVAEKYSWRRMALQYMDCYVRIAPSVTRKQGRHAAVQNGQSLTYST